MATDYNEMCWAVWRRMDKANKRETGMRLSPDEVMALCEFDGHVMERIETVALESEGESDAG